MTVYTTSDIVLYDSEAHTEIRVSPCGDALGMIVVKCADDYYGKIDFSVAPDVAVALANALLKQVELSKDL